MAFEKLIRKFCKEKDFVPNSNSEWYKNSFKRYEYYLRVGEKIDYEFFKKHII